MTFIIFLVGLINVILFKNNPKKFVFYLLILFPYFGLIEFYLRDLSILYAIFFDFVFIIPIYFLYFFKKNKNSNFIELKKITLLIVFYILLHIIYIFTPNNPYPLIGRLIGFKIWTFYLFFIFIGYYFLETKEDFKKIINILSLGVIIPCSIVLIQYLIALLYGYEQAFFLIEAINKVPIDIAQPGYSSFNLGTIKLFRLNSTFTSVTELANYLIFSFVPVITALHLDNNRKYIFLNRMAFTLLIVASFICGARSMFLFTPIILLFYTFLKYKIKKFFTYVLFFTFILIFFYFFNILYLKNFLTDYYLLFSGYSSMVTSGLFDFIINNFWGNGVGSATGEVRFLFNVDPTTDLASIAVYERYYYKILYETGFIGLVAYLFISFKFISYPLNLLKKDISEPYKSFVSISLTFLILVFYLFAFKGFSIDLFPISFMKFFLIGLLLKIYFLNTDDLNNTSNKFI